MGQFTCGSQIDVQLFNNVNWQTDRAGLVHDCPFDGLTNPPGCVSRETEPTLWVKLLNGADQPQVTFFNQIQQSQTTIAVTTGNLHDQTQVTFNHATA